MREKILLFFKGFLIGLGKIMPGVSGGVLAISLGVYERAIEAFVDFFKCPKENFLFLLFLGLGAVFAIILGSDVILFCLDFYYLPTMLLFIGLMVGGIPSIKREVSFGSFVHHIGFVLVPIVLFLIVLMFPYFFGLSSSFFSFLFLGVVDAVTMVIPGLSGTAIFMIIDCYSMILDMFSSLKSIEGIFAHFWNVVPFGIGVMGGIIAVSRVMNYLFHYYKVPVYCMILCFSVFSIFTLFVQTLSSSYSLFEVVVGIIFFGIGCCISYFMENKY